MTATGGNHRDVVVASVGTVLFAFEAARVERISADDEEGALDAGRRLRIDGRDLHVGPEVFLERLPASAFSPPPEFLDGVWRRLGVHSLVQVRGRLALAVDPALAADLPLAAV